MSTTWPSIKPKLVWREPEDNWKVICEAFASATRSISIPIYEIGGPPVTEALCEAKARGVEIFVMFNGQFFVGPDRYNSRYDQVYAVVEALERAPGSGLVAFAWAANNFAITHQKTILIDATVAGRAIPVDLLPSTAKALVLTMNLCRYAWMMSDSGQRSPMPWQFWGPRYPEMKGFPLRDFGVILTEPALVNQIAQIFESDFQGPLGNTTNNLSSSTNGLVWSNGSTGIPSYYPNGGAYPSFSSQAIAGAVDQGNARAVHLQLIAAAQTSLIVYNEEMADSGIVAALSAAAARGVELRVMLTGNVNVGSGGVLTYEYADQYAQLVQAGASVRLVPAGPGFMYIHAKVLLADAGTPQAIAFMGSQNISGSSQNFNRELGVQLAGVADTALFIETFNRDWAMDGLLQWPSQGTPTPKAPTEPVPLYNPSRWLPTPMPQGPILPR